jgi:hypothetical protein
VPSTFVRSSGSGEFIFPPTIAKFAMAFTSMLSIGFTELPAVIELPRLAPVWLKRSSLPMKAWVVIMLPT